MNDFSSKFLDKILFGVGLFTLIAPLTLLNSEQLLSKLVSTKRKANLEILGTTKTSNNDIRRRSRGSLSWYQLEKDQEVFNRDTIFSGNESTASFQIIEAGKSYNFDLGANTLVQLVKENGQTTIDLQSGSISSKVKKGSKLRVKLGKKTTELTSKGEGSVKIIKDEKASSIDVSKGEVEVETDNKKEVLDEKKLLKIESNTIKVSEPQITNLAPTDDKVFVYRGKDPLKLTWKASPEIKKFNVEIAKNSKFTNSWKKTINKTSINVPKFKVSNSYFWRVSDALNAKEISKSARFLYIDETGFKNIYPPNNYKKENVSADSIKQSFSWSPVQNASKFKLETSYTEDFKSIITQTSHENTEALVDIPTDESLYWRVTAEITNSSEKITSTPHQLNFDKKIKIVEPPKAEQGPQFVENAPIMGPNLPSSTKIAGTAPTTSVPTATPELAKPNMQKTKAEPVDPFLNAKLSLKKINNQSKKVDPAKMNFTKEITVNWQGNVKGEQVEILVSKNKSFKKAKKVVTRKPAAVIRLSEPGAYHVKARYLRKDGNPVKGSTTKPTTFRYKPKYIVARPRLEQPSNDLKLVSFGKEPVSIYFEWRKIPYAESYVIQMSSDKSFSKIIKEEKTNDNSFYLNQNIDQPKLYWRVQAQYKGEKSKWSKFRNIHLNTAK